MQTFTGKEYIKIDVANNFGLDKKSWAERIAWFDAHEDHLLDMLPQAETPAMYYAGVQAWQDVKAGKPIGYMISLDATASGLQLLAALTGDRRAAEACNVVNTNQRADAYTLIYQEMIQTIGEQSKIKRDDVKRAVMTSLYGSQAVPKDVFGTGILLNVFMNTMNDMAPGAWELNQAFLDIWDDKVYSHDWVLPDNFHVHVKVMSSVQETVHWDNEPIAVTYKINEPVKNGRSLGANTIHSLDGLIVREICRRCDYDPQWIQLVRDLLDDTGSHAFSEKDAHKADRLVKILWDHYLRTGYLSARILNHIDENTINLVDRVVIKEMVDSLPKKPFKVITVHDCFRCLPHYGNDLRREYNRQLMMIAKSSLLSDLLSQLTLTEQKVGQLDKNLWKDIMDADYALS